MTDLPGSPTSRVFTTLKHDTQSSRNQTVMQGLAAREVEIVTAPGTGSTMAFDELQKVYSPRLFKTILRITKNWEDAEDALQDISAGIFGSASFWGQIKRLLVAYADRHQFGTDGPAQASVATRGIADLFFRGRG